jgi:hypothetical protein
MLLAGFEPTIPVFKRAKIFHALDRAATVTGNKSFIQKFKIANRDQETSNLVAGIISKETKFHTIGEALVRPVCAAIVRTKFGNEAEEEIKKIFCLNDVMGTIKIQCNLKYESYVDLESEISETSIPTVPALKLQHEPACIVHQAAEVLLRWLILLRKKN